MFAYICYYKRFVISPALCAGLGLMLSACAPAEPPEPEKKTQEVGVVTLQTRPVELFKVLPGRITPFRVAEVRPQVDGIIIERLFEQGSSVEAGQVLYRIDPKPYRADVASAEADLARARAAVSAVEQRARRFGQLLADNAVSAQEYDDVEAELAQNRAQVDVARAALQRARINLDYTTVEAPIDGRIGRSLFTEGALVTANQEKSLAQITRLDPVYLDISRSSDELLRLKKAFEQGSLKKAAPGKARVSLLLDDGSEYAQTGELQFSDVTVDPGTGSVVLRAIFPNPAADLLPGMFVRARLSEGVRDNALLVPQQGVTHSREGEPVALVVNADNKVERRQLQAREAVETFWLVTDGLKAGEKVIVTGSQKVSEGDTVNAVPADIPNKPMPGLSENKGRTTPLPLTTPIAPDNDSAAGDG